MIRKAFREDYPDIESHCKEFWKHSPFNEEYKDGSAQFYMDLAYDCGLLYVAELQGKIIGFAAGCYSPLMGDSSVLQGSELAWWVEESHRGGRAGIALLNALEAGAKDAGCKYWNMIYMVTSMPETIKRIYEKRGYTQKEVVYGRIL